MIDTAQVLLEKIRLGEDSFLELKEVVFSGSKIKGPRREELADEMAAFANARGGVIVFGVDDRREIVGIPDERLDDVERYVVDIVRDSITPSIYPIIERLQLPASDGSLKPVIRVEIPRSLFVHRSSGGYLHRVGSSKREMEPDYLARLFQQRSQARIIRFDEQVVPNADLSDLDDALIDRFRTYQTRDDRTTLLRKLAMAREDDRGILRPTVAGLLMGSRRPQEPLSHAMIQAVSYRGTAVTEHVGDTSYQLDAKDVTGQLDAQVVEACIFVLRNQKVAASKKVGRKDLPQYDMTALFEALVNAVAHRDYSMSGARIRLRMFSDRLELYSPGALPNTMTVDSLPFRQASRNEAITSLLAKCPVPAGIAGLESRRTTMMDRRGEGVAIIMARSERLSGRQPVYEMLDDSELRLTIFAANPQVDES
ncbi:divergent AAA domain protein [bacterium BMS3Bbin12]|nr:divergent AAA domain protein [bacterium BMS3Bbin12]GBE49670.1 divergent AAA domain protein [bacterium BMS3Bbin13]